MFSAKLDKEFSKSKPLRLVDLSADNSDFGVES